MRMGLPQVVTTNNGSEFKNKLNAEMMKLLGIKQSLITPYHPQVHMHEQLYEDLIKHYRGCLSKR